jgi:predicted Ser/Thr protein kinase
VVTSEEAWPGPAIRPVRQSLNKEFGRYQIIRTLGEGGMGTVYLAHDTQLDRPVALKVPIFTEDDGPDVLKRFYREARTAATILHSNICPVYDVGEINGIHFLSMAYIEGKLLWNYIAGGQPLPYRHAAVLVRKLALAIQEAHNHGIIHRDLKPANVIINKNSEPIIMDFGLAKRVDDQNQRLTKTGQVLGTIVYMSPEQVTGNMALMGPPADIYSLGVILYELLTAHAPYEGTPASVVTNIVTKPPPRVAEWRQDVPARLEAICQKAMAKDIGDRFASMTEFGAALAEYLRLDAQAGAPATGKPAAKPTGGMPAKVVAKAKAGAANAPARAPTPGPRKVAPTPRGNGRAAPAKNGGEQPVLAIPDAEAAAPIWRRLPVWAWIAGACGAIALFVLLLLVML